MEYMLYFKYGIAFFELLSATFGVIYWHKIKASHWKYFVGYLFLVFLGELLFYLLYFRGQYSASRILVNNIIIPLEFLFFFWLFYKNGSPRKMVILGVVLYILCFFIEIWMNQQGNKFYFLSFSYSIGNIILLILIFQYFIQLSNSDRILHFFHERMFWVSLGLLLFWLGTFPYYGLFNLLMKKHFELFVSYSWVMIFLDYAMYIMFAISFVWSREN